MTREFFNNHYLDRMFIAKADMPDVKYIWQYGGGIRSDARTIKEGDIVCVTGFSWDIDTVSIGTRELLYRMNELTFKQNFKHIDAISWDTLADEGYFNTKYIPGRGVCGLMRFAYTTGLCYGIGKESYAGRYCYEFVAEGQAAILTWDGIGDPSGDWIKHKGIFRGEYANPSLKQAE